MKINEVKNALNYITKTGLCPLLMGQHGIGKTESVKQFAIENGYEFIDLRLGTQEPGDLLGLADFEKNENGEIITTKFFRPSWFPTHGKHVVFLDEINRAPKYVLQAVFQLILDKRIHEHVLPEETIVVAACNPDTEDYDVTDMSDPAFLDRFCVIKVENDLNTFLEFATKSNVDSSITHFLAENPTYLASNNEDFEIESFVNPSNRSWFFVDKLMKLNPPDKIFRGLISGIVGPAAALQYINHKENYEKKFDPELVLYKYDSVRPEIVSLLKSEVVRFDLLNLLNTEILVKLEEKVDSLVTMDIEEMKKTSTKYTVKNETVLNNLSRYVLDMPIESAVAFLNQIKKNKNLLIGSGVYSYLGDNDEIFKVITTQKERAQKLMKDSAKQNEGDSE
jgi:hypothetical protein